MARLTTFSRFLITLVLLAVIFFGGRYLLKGTGYLDKKITVVDDLGKADNVTNGLLSSAPQNYQTIGLKQLALPSENAGGSNGSKLYYYGMGWNAQTPISYANGGSTTKAGSLMAKNNISLNFVRQDDYGKMQEEIVKHAVEFKSNPNTPGVFCGIMGDNMASFKVALDEKLKAVDPSYEVKGFYVTGYSYGEDKFIGPVSWKRDPQKARGGLCSVVLKDGDQNIAIKWASDNDVPINPDPTVYDPTRLNFVGTSTFVESADRYVANQTLELPEIKDGKKTGKTTSVKIDACATWSPEDEKVFKTGRDIVSLLSTRENVKQMPCLVLGLNKYISSKADVCKRFVSALSDAGDQVKTFDAALRYGCQKNGEVFGDEANWYELYRGKEIEMPQGRSVAVGGSRSCNLSDVADDLGVSPNSTNCYSSVYTLFANYMSKLYPGDLPKFPSAAEAVDLSIVRGLYASADKSKLADGFKDKITTGDMTEVYGRKNYNIEFETGRSTFTGSSAKVLEEIYNSLNTTNLRMTIKGHTDNAGSYEANMSLSQARADAVRQWIMRRAKNNFPPERFAHVQGYGSDKPVASNDTPDGKAKNRRVEIVFGD
jgi:OmpA-OmpF porin, OOP family